LDFKLNNLALSFRLWLYALPPSPTFVPKVGLGEPRSFGAGTLSFALK